MQDWHKADIKAALEKAGWSLGRLGVLHGYTRWYLKAAFVSRQPAAERIIAQAIGKQARDLWPSRYQAGIMTQHADGTPKKRRYFKKDEAQNG